MSSSRDAYLTAIEQKRLELRNAYVNERFEEGDKLKALLDEMERHARSRGWLHLDDRRR